MSERVGYEANLQRGQMLRQSGRFDDACRYLGEAIQAAPDQPQPYLELALAQSEIPGKKADSLRSIDRAVALDPVSGRILGFKAYLISHFGRHKEALAIARDALKLDPLCYITLLAHANAYTKLGDWRNAELYSRRILQTYPEDSSALNLLSQALRFLDRPGESQAVLVRILARVPNDPFAQTNAGYEALKVYDPVRAEIHFRNALRVDPFFEHARRGFLQSLRLRSWLFRLNSRLLNLYDRGRYRNALLRVLIVFAIAASGGIILAFVFIYLMGALTLLPLANFCLYFRSDARPLLNRKEKVRALAAGVIEILILSLCLLEQWWWPAALLASYMILLGLSLLAPGWMVAFKARRQMRATLDPDAGSLPSS